MPFNEHHKRRKNVIQWTSALGKSQILLGFPEALLSKFKPIDLLHAPTDDPLCLGDESLDVKKFHALVRFKKDIEKSALEFDSKREILLTLLVPHMKVKSDKNASFVSWKSKIEGFTI